MQHPAVTARWSQAVADLRRHCKGEILDTAADLGPYSRDFGGMMQGCPGAVARVSSESDVLGALRIAAEHDLEVTTRGVGHGQSGQSLGDGLVLDMTHFDGVTVSTSGPPVLEAEAGATWEHVCSSSLPHGFLPIALTQALDTTVAGTLSVAGVGAESFRSGPQVDNVLYFDVALPEGGVVRCSPEQHRDLFDVVRGGFGQCGVILRVGYPLRPSPPAIRTRCLAYADPRRAVGDLASLCQPGSAARWITAGTARDPRGLRRWLSVLFVAHDTEELEQATLRRASPDFEVPWRSAPIWSVDGAPRHPFFRRFGMGSAERTDIHPWVEHIFSVERAGDALHQLFAEHGDLLERGKIGLIPMRRLSRPAPLFVTPESELLVGIGAFPTFTGSERAIAEATMSRYHERMCILGGKRYLSGFLPNRAGRDWAGHYGPTWAAFRACKMRFDPRGRLNPGFIAWD